ncbi:MAG: DUF2946 domain-containing protein [Burkholderiales bacterium]|nr:DUF2946 domain-containing protein [Burkholderiales bacterium]
MLRRRMTQRLIASLSALVMLFAALAPSMANALGRSSPVMWVELCSGQGTKRVAIDASGTPVTTSGDATGSPESNAPEQANAAHCPYCQLQATSVVLPEPAANAPLPLRRPAATYPDRFYDAPRPSHAWAPTRSRAPPLIG